MKMQRLWITLVLLAVSIFPAAARPQDSLLTLAKFMPQETNVFVAMRVDDDYLTTLDALLAKMAAATMQSRLPPNFGIRAEIGRAMELFDPQNADYEMFRAWAGETIAGGVILTPHNLMGGEPPASFLAIEVNDPLKVLGYMETLTKNFFTSYAISETDGGLLYTPEDRFAPTFYLTDAALFQLATLDEPILPVNNTPDSLFASARFQAALNQLPASNYNLLVYADLAPALSNTLTLALQQPGQTPLPPQAGDIPAILRTLGPTIIGFAMPDNRALVLDMAQTITDVAAFEKAIGLPWTVYPPLSRDFTALVPADAALVIQDQGFGPLLLMNAAVLERLGDALDEQFSDVSVNDDEAVLLLLDDAVTFLKLWFKGLTGQTFEEGVGWMTGNFAVFLRFSLAQTPSFDIGLLVENTDNAAAQAFFSGQKQALTDMNIGYDDRGSYIVIPGIRQMVEEFTGLSAGQMPLLSHLELALGLNDRMLAAGTRPAVEMILNSNQGGLAADPTFRAATAYFLPEMQSLWYLNMAPLQSALAFAGENRDVRNLAALLSLFSSASLTSRSNEQGQGISRLVLVMK